jgi:hypothetical protein
MKMNTNIGMEIYPEYQVARLDPLRAGVSPVPSSSAVAATSPSGFGIYDPDTAFIPFVATLRPSDALKSCTVDPWLFPVVEIVR